MMQSCRRPEHGSSGELDVFGATSYFAGCLPAPPDDDDCRPSSATEPSADRLYFQAKVVQRDTRTRATEDKSFRSPHQQPPPPPPGVHDHAERGHATNKQLLVVAAAKRRQASGKSKLAALLSFMVSPSPSPSPRASFRKDKKKKQEAALSSTATRLRQEEAASEAGGEEGTYNYKAGNSPSSWSHESSMQLQGLFGAHDDDDEDELDLGVVTGDRRLQGITVVRRGGGGGGGNEERWVVRCVTGGAWDDEEHREKMLDASAESAASSEQNMIHEQGHDDDDGNIDDPAQYSWDSDSSSDLFDLDLEYR